MIGMPVQLLSSALAENGAERGQGYVLDSDTIAGSRRVTLITRLAPGGRAEFDLADPSGVQEYTLRSVLNLWELRDETYSEYLKRMTSLGEVSVSFINRRAILDFLSGAAKTLPGAKGTSAGGGDQGKAPSVVESSQGEGKVIQGRDSRQGPSIELKDLEVSLKISSGQTNLGDYKSQIFIPEESGKNFAQILEISQNLLLSGKRGGIAGSLDYSRSDEPHKDHKTTVPAVHDGRRVHQKPPPHASRRHLRHSASVPIIIVPSGVQPMINLLNVKSFLMDGLYAPISDVQDIYQQKPECVIIERQIKSPHGSGPRMTIKRYKVIDSADNLKPSDWDRVIAAFVTGQTWQFKKWKWNEPAELFGKIRGFCVKYVDDPPPGLVGKWSVIQLLIHRTWRHNDRSAANQFWKEIDDFLLQNAASRPKP